MRHLPTLAIAALAAFSCSACGGGFEDASALPGEEGVTKVTQQYLHAIAEGDGPAACGVLDKASQQALIARLGVAGNCLDAIQAASRELSAEQKSSLTELEVEDATAHGNNGSAHVRLSPEVARLTGVRGGTVSLVRTELHWGITGLS